MNCYSKKDFPLVSPELNNGAVYWVFRSASSDIMKNSMYFSAADVRGQQIYYSNVSNLAFCQPFF